MPCLDDTTLKVLPHFQNPYFLGHAHAYLMESSGGNTAGPGQRAPSTCRLVPLKGLNSHEDHHSVVRAGLLHLWAPNGHCVRLWVSILVSGLEGILHIPGGQCQTQLRLPATVKWTDRVAEPRDTCRHIAAKNNKPFCYHCLVIGFIVFDLCLSYLFPEFCFAFRFCFIGSLFL